MSDLGKMSSRELKWVCVKDYYVPSITYGVKKYQLSYQFMVGDVCSILQYDDEDIYCGYWVGRGNSHPLYKVKMDVFEHFKLLDEIREEKLKELGI